MNSSPVSLLPSSGTVLRPASQLHVLPANWLCQRSPKASGQWRGPGPQPFNPGWPPTITTRRPLSSNGVLPTPKKASGTLHSLAASRCQTRFPLEMSRQAACPRRRRCSSGWWSRAACSAGRCYTQMDRQSPSGKRNARANGRSRPREPRRFPRGPTDGAGPPPLVAPRARCTRSQSAFPKPAANRSSAI